MATVLDSLLPAGWSNIRGDIIFDQTRTGRPGRFHVNVNDPYAIWEYTVTYKKADYETATGENFDDIYNFWLTTANGFAFMVDAEFDNTTAARGGSGVVLQLGSDFRLFKRYSFGGRTYDHPITRPKTGLTLGGGAAGGTASLTTGIVTGDGISAGTWSGGFYRPMLPMDNGLSWSCGPDQIVTSLAVRLQENLEI